MVLSTAIQIGGMTCGACLALITENLEKMSGVQSASISLMTETGVVKHTSSVTPEAIKECVEDLGFDAAILTTTDSDALPAALPLLASPALTPASLAAAALLARTSASSTPVSGTPPPAAHTRPTLPPSRLQTKFTVEGMTCGACVAAITKGLEQAPGVELVDILLMTETGVVVHRATTLASTIIEQVEECGFGALFVLSEPVVAPAPAPMRTPTLELRPVFASGSRPLVIRISTPPSLASPGSSAPLDSPSRSSPLHPSPLKAVSEPALPALPDDEFLAPPAIEKLTLGFSLLGDGDASVLDRTLGTYPGVLKVQPGRERNSIVVTYDPWVVGPRDIFDSLVDAGLSPAVASPFGAQDLVELLQKTRDIELWTARCLSFGVAGVPVFLLSNILPMFKVHIMVMVCSGLALDSLIQFVLTTYIQFVLGRPYYISAYGSLSHGLATMDVLIVVLTTLLYAFLVLLMGISLFQGSSHPPHLLFATLAMLFFFILLGRLLELRAKGQTLLVLSKLIQLQPQQCIIVADPSTYDQSTASGVVDFGTREIPVELVQLRDIAVVLPGARVPADGVVVFGSSDVDELLLTGEFVPVHKQLGLRVISGSVNGLQPLHMLVGATGKQTQLNQIVELMRDAQMAKAPIQQYSDYIAGRFVPIVLALLVLTFAYWCWYAFRQYDAEMRLGKAVLRKLVDMFGLPRQGRLFSCLLIAILVVVAACPCALGLAAPTAVMVGTGVGATHGVLIKGGAVLEKVSSVDTVLLDKTGTLTTGLFLLGRFEIDASAGLDAKAWWRVMGAVETLSEHPVGRAVASAARRQLEMEDEEGFGDCTVELVRVNVGVGIEAVVVYAGQPHQVVLGSAAGATACLDARGASAVSETEAAASHATRVYTVVDGRYAGFVEVEDTIKPDAAAVVAYMKRSGYRVAMVTGDNVAAAVAVASAVGIAPTNVFANKSPSDKAALVLELQQGLVVAFVGDGINDAPALVQADVGVLVASGTDIAIDAADAVLMGVNAELLLLIPTCFLVARATFLRIKLNFVWAMLYNLVVLPLAMGCFLRWGVAMPPMASGAAMAMLSVSVVLSSLHLKWWRPPVIPGVVLQQPMLELGMVEVGEMDEDVEVGAWRRPVLLLQRLRRVFTKTAPVNEYQLVDRG